MPAIQCNKCQKSVEFTLAQAGKSLPCPHCGETNSLPTQDAVSTAAEAPHLATSKGLPSATGPETPVMTVHQAMFGSKPFSFLILCMAAITGLGGGIYFALVALLPAAIAAGGIGALCLLTLVFWRMVRHSRRLEITNRRIFDKQGLLSRKVNEIRIQDIRDMQVVQSFPERLLGVGRLSISTAGQSDYEIEICDIPSPNKVREVIDLYRRI